MDYMRQQTQGGHFGGYQPHGGYGGYHGSYNDPHKGTQGDFMEEIYEMAHGRKPIPEELKAIICTVVKEQTDSMLGQYGYTQHGQPGREQHLRYKEILEELRDVPNVTEAVKRATQHFDDLTEEDKKVLQQILNRPSYKRMAQMVNMTPERFMEVKHDLERKLKR